MQHLTFARKATGRFEILCLGAHSDDIEIGAGGTILTLLDRFPDARVRWIVFAANEQRANEARASAMVFLSAAGEAKVTVHGFRDGFFPDEFSQLKQTFESLKAEINPDLILTHARGDHHQDHRVVADLTWNTFRDHLILGYEVIKYDPDLGNPNVFVPLEPNIAERKVNAIMDHFHSQHGRRWFVAETFLAVMRIRGVHSAAPSGLAEGFYGPKLCL
jgi:LmbE family N-acetylglucosaminyl deacetylase